MEDELNCDECPIRGTETCINYCEYRDEGRYTPQQPPAVRLGGDFEK